MRKVAFYKITLTPSGPYFFGNENTFKYQKSKQKEDNPYFISGEDVPSQSTVFGSLRYILLPEKGFDKLCDLHNVKAVGEIGFDMDREEVQTFGAIKRMSAVFISKEDELFVPTPFDHNCDKEEKMILDTKEVPIYTPFSEYYEIETLDGKKLYTKEYNAKEGISCSFMSVKDNHLEKDLINSNVRVGINRKTTKDGFFKKEYKSLKPGFAFCVFAEIENDNLFFTEKVYLVSMGQGKIPFAVKFEKTETIQDIEDVYGIIKEAILKKSVAHKRFYCLSDMVVGNTLYEKMKFAIVMTRNHRSFKRIPGKYSKGAVLHRLVKAGSIFFADDIKLEDFAYSTISQRNSFNIGYNQVITVDEK